MHSFLCQLWLLSGIMSSRCSRPHGPQTENIYSLVPHKRTLCWCLRITSLTDPLPGGGLTMHGPACSQALCRETRVLTLAQSHDLL